jgi:hypothetical protein
MFFFVIATLMDHSSRGADAELSVARIFVVTDVRLQEQALLLLLSTSATLKP